MAVCLRHRHTLRLPAQCKSFHVFSSQTSLLNVLDNVSDFDTCILIGSGSNVVLPSYHPGEVIHNAIHGVVVEKDNQKQVDLRVGAGVVWHDLVRYCMQKRWYGLENLALIPGTVGAAPVQNIGAYGVEIADVLLSCEVMDIQSNTIKTMRKEDCGFGYRSSIFKGFFALRYIILSVCLRLHKQPVCNFKYPRLSQWLAKKNLQPTPEHIFHAVMSIRRTRLPDWHRVGTVGSFFVNPVVSREQFQSLSRWHAELHYVENPSGGIKLFAGRLLTLAGWRGFQDAGLSTSAKNPLVIVHKYGGSRKRLIALISAMQASVHALFSIKLVVEPVIFPDIYGH